MSGALRRQVRAYILATISHTCRRVSKGTLAECLRLEGASLDALVRRPGFLRSTRTSTLGLIFLHVRRALQAGLPGQSFSDF